MHDHVDFLRGEDFLERGDVGQAGFEQAHAGRDRRPVAIDEVVEDDRLVPGSDELADHMATALEGRSAVLLGNHGTITTGDNLEQAYSRALLLEWLCGLYYRARLLGEPRLLDLEEIDKVGRQLEHYLQDPGRS